MSGSRRSWRNAQGLAHRRDQPGADVVAHRQEGFQGLAVGVVEGQVDGLHRAGEDRAGLLGVVAHRHHQAEVLVQEAVHVLRRQALRWDACQAQGLEGPVRHLGLGTGAGGEGADPPGQVVVDQGLRHLGAAGVSGAEDEDGLGWRGHGGRLVACGKGLGQGAGPGPQGELPAGFGSVAASIPSGIPSRMWISTRRAQAGSCGWMR